MASFSEYDSFAYAVTGTARSGSPREWIVGPAMAKVFQTTCTGLGGGNSCVPSIPFFQAVLDNGLQRGWDGLTVHPYDVSEIPASPDVFVTGGYLNNLRQMVSAAGSAVPILVGEWGYKLPWHGGSDETPYQPAYAIRMWLSDVAAGVPLTVWYHWEDGGDGPYGLLDGSGSPRQSYWALRFAAERLLNATFVAKVSTNPSTTQYNFQISGKNVYVAYTDTPGSMVLAVVPGSYQIDSLNLATNPPTIVSSSILSTGTITVNLNQTPVILSQH